MTYLKDKNTSQRTSIGDLVIMKSITKSLNSYQSISLLMVFAVWKRGKVRRPNIMTNILVTALVFQAVQRSLKNHFDMVEDPLATDVQRLRGD